MIVVRKAQDRGRFDFAGLDTRHAFSFGDCSAAEALLFDLG